jgi:WD40 repeat protein
MFGVSLFATGLSFVGNSLQPCEWLDIATGRSGCLRTWPIDRGSAYEIAFSPDGSVLATSDPDGPLKVYNVSDGKLLYELPGQQHECGESVSFSADGALMAAISTNGEISIRDVKTWSLRKSFGGVANSIQFSPDGRLFAANIENSGIRVWRTSDWQLQWQIPVGRKMRFTADGQLLAAYTANGLVGIWSMTDGTGQHSVHTDNYRFALSPDGTRVATNSYGDALKLWDATSDSLLRTIPAKSSGDVAYSSDGRYLLAGEHYYQLPMSFVYQVGLWRVADGQQVAVLPAYLSTDCVAFASKSNVFGYGSWKSLKVFRLRQD